jgi:hypothetical protein
MAYEGGTSDGEVIDLNGKLGRVFAAATQPKPVQTVLSETGRSRLTNLGSVRFSW